MKSQPNWVFNNALSTKKEMMLAMVVIAVIPRVKPMTVLFLREAYITTLLPNARSNMAFCTNTETIATETILASTSIIQPPS